MNWIRKNWFQVGILFALFLSIILGLFYIKYVADVPVIKITTNPIVSISATTTASSTKSSGLDMKTMKPSETVTQENNSNQDTVSNNNFAELAESRKDCSNAATQWEEQNSNNNSSGNSETYQNFFNSKTSSCYLREFYTFDIFDGENTRYEALISFRDIYENMPIAACLDNNAVNYSENEYRCSTASGDPITMNQFNNLVNKYVGQ